MHDTNLEAMLRRDRDVTLIAVILLTLLAWAYLLWLSSTMSAAPGMDGMDMGGMEMAAAPGIKAWAAADYLFTFAMWLVMMIGMMLPSAAPMILLYAQVGRQA